jgi:hypothetical protein
VTDHTKLLVQSEPPLRVFVTSVQQETQWARDVAVQELTELDYEVWAFEYTPASATSAEDAYLPKARDADFTVWLVGSETSAAVRNEIAEVLAASKDIIAIRLPATSRDTETESLFRQVRDVSKTRDASTPEELRRELRAALSDELRRAFRGRPSLTRRALLAQFRRASRVRVEAGWIAADVDEEDAAALAADNTIGVIDGAVPPIGNISILVGEVGIGKSLTAERAHEQAISVAQSSANAPIPVFLRAEEVGSSLETAVRTRGEGLGDPRMMGADLVVDGLDETDPINASRILEQARELVRTWPSSRAILTSRDQGFLEKAPEVFRMNGLTEDESRALVARVAGRELSEVARLRWPEWISDAVTRPLFATLIASDLRRGGSVPESTGQLLSNLVDRMLHRTPGEVFEPLMALAAKSTDRGGGLVPLRELGTLEIRRRAESSRLIRIEGDRVGLALPILGQWFAAQSLLEGRTKIGDLMSEHQRLSRWRYPVAVAIAVGSRDQVDGLLGALARADPGFAARAIGDSVTQLYGAQPVDDIPSSLDAARSMRRAYDAWTEGLSPVAATVLPRDDEGNLAPVAAHASESWGQGHLLWGWFLGDHSDGVIEFPQGLNFLNPEAPWEPSAMGQMNFVPGWAWRVTLEELSKELNSMLRVRSLFVQDDDLQREVLSIVARAIVRQYDRTAVKELTLDVVEDALRRRDEIETLLGGSVPIGRTYPFFGLETLRAQVAELRRAGASSIGSPWPGSDSSQGFLWYGWSVEEQVHRVTAVLEAAARVYPRLVEEWFPRLAHRMRTYVTLPAVVRASLFPDEGEHRGMGPTLEWYLDPVAPDQPSSVEITIGESVRGGEHMRSMVERLVQMRPEHAEWLTAHLAHGNASQFFKDDPLSAWLYGWLTEDLKGAGWSG